MDVAKEFKEVDFRIKMDIRRKALIAEAKIYDMTPEDYAAKLDAERAAETAAAYKDAAYQVGVLFGTMQRSLQEAAESLAAGIRAAFGR